MKNCIGPSGLSIVGNINKMNNVKPIPTLTESDLKRFWSKVDKRGPNDCWEWMAGTYDGIRGRFTLGLLDYVASRVSYFIHTGKQPGVKDVCHTCDDPRCVNPKHLWIGTRGDNNHDREAKGRSAPVQGSVNGNSKLTEKEVIAIRQSPENCTTLGIKYSVHLSLISRIRLRKCWRHI